MLSVDAVREMAVSGELKVRNPTSSSRRDLKLARVGFGHGHEGKMPALLGDPWKRRTNKAERSGRAWNLLSLCFMSQTLEPATKLEYPYVLIFNHRLQKYLSAEKNWVKTQEEALAFSTMEQAWSQCRPFLHQRGIVFLIRFSSGRDGVIPLE